MDGVTLLSERRARVVLGGKTYYVRCESRQTDDAKAVYWVDPGDGNPVRVEGYDRDFDEAGRFLGATHEYRLQQESPPRFFKSGVPAPTPAGGVFIPVFPPRGNPLMKLFPVGRSYRYDAKELEKVATKNPETMRYDPVLGALIMYRGAKPCE